MTKQLENRISSREVTEMMELKQHSDLLRKIDTINEDFRKSNITFSKYWIESTYKVEGQKREYREFQITKRGCEFLAHKATGTKGNLFTDRYMGKFEQMEEIIANNLLINQKSIEDKIYELLIQLPNDELKNVTVNRLLDFLGIPSKSSKRIIYPKVNFPEEEFRKEIAKFIANGEGVINEQLYGLAIEKEKLFKHFYRFGLTKIEVAKLLQGYRMLYQTGDDKTQRIRVAGIPTRALVIKYGSY